MADTANTCGCCTGVETATPRPMFNRPGLGTLAYRAGEHATFLETMKARLSAGDYPALSGLTSRAAGDASIAFLDAWATVADVLTFYQERIANEGYLRTATERRSILELARLVGYAPRPGVAASVWLALELETGRNVTIQPNEIKAQSMPGPGELPQTFENIELLDARSEWNSLRPALARPQTKDRFIKVHDSTDGLFRIFLSGTDTNVKIGDVMLVTDSSSPGPKDIYRVVSVGPDPSNDRTLVKLAPMQTVAKPAEKLPRPDVSGIVKAAESYAGQEILGKWGLSIEDDTVTKIAAHLKSLTVKLGTAGITANDAMQAIQEVLENIGAEKAAVTGPASDKLANWVGEISDGFKKASNEVMEQAARQNAEAFVNAMGRGGGSGSAGNAAARADASAHAEALPAKAAYYPAYENTDPLVNAVVGLTKAGSIPPRNSASMDRKISNTFAGNPETRDYADNNLQVAGALQAKLKRTLATVLAGVEVSLENRLQVYVFRVAARPFGHNAPLKPRGNNDGAYVENNYEWSPKEMSEKESPDRKTIFLDANYDKITDKSWVLVDMRAVLYDQNADIVPSGGNVLLLERIRELSTGISRQAYSMCGASTAIKISRDWWTYQPYYSGLNQTGDGSFNLIRQTVVYAQSEKLTLADEPFEEQIPAPDGKTGSGGETGTDKDFIELDGLYSGLQSGRWLIVSGERDDITYGAETEIGKKSKVEGISATELVMLAEVRNSPVPGVGMRTFIKLAKKLEYKYRRDTVTIYANVVKATHGETRRETLGNGNSAKSFLTFTLKQPPLTFVASPIPAGSESTLKVYVNDLQWHETDSLTEAVHNDRVFLTKTDNDGKTSVVFGDGDHGARPPSGTENVRAIYRNGIGRCGNVLAEQISQLMSKPLGVKGVINPMRASGGADRESGDTARKNAPRTVTALDRLISVSDYADFACTFAGIGKAAAKTITDGKMEWVHVTIAGADDIPIDETSDLYRNLVQALHDYGGLGVPVAVQSRELLLIFVSARVCILPDYTWETVSAQIRAKMLDIFGFERREPGQDVYLSEVVATVQSVPGVSYVDVDAFGGIPEKTTDADYGRRPLTPGEISKKALEFLDKKVPEASIEKNHRLEVNLADCRDGVMWPAQLAYLSPDVADTLVIDQIK